ncbi:MAG: phosphodiester glycosidase family protein [Verrucomicrobiota bacterium]
MALTAVWLFSCAVAAAAQEITKVEEAGISYRVIVAAPSQIRVVWKDEKQNQLKQIPAADAYLRRNGEDPVMITNGGIYEPGLVPSGLLIQEGKEMNPVNRRKGKGNFFLQPNGIFLIRDGKAEVLDTVDYRGGTGVSFAVQSGPLLLKGGKTHPVFKANSKYRLHRNGTGVRKDGKVIIAITDFRQAKLPTLHDFADFFRRKGCDDALFLDGDISLMRGRGELGKRGNPFASMIAVVAEARG